MNAPEPLPPDLVELLESERDIDAPSPAVRERSYARLAPLLLATAAGAPVVAASKLGIAAEAASSVGAAGTAGAKLVVVSVISVLSGALGGAAGHAYYAARSAPVASVAPRPVAAPPASVEVAPPPTAGLESAPAVTPPPPSPGVKLAEPPRSAASLRSERLLLETASVALKKGDHASALAALRQHAQRFPRGTLAQEREVLMVQALAASGNEQGAQDRAKDFKRKFPGSLQQDSVDKASKAK